MSNVGPQLPPHLAKRKRSIDDEAKGSDTPPHKLQAASTSRVQGPSAPPPQNPEELNIDDSSKDDYGPSLKPANPSTKTAGPSQPPRTVGPSLPPQAHNPDELNLDDSSADEDYGLSVAKPPPPKRVLGPTAPPAPLSQRPSHPSNPNDSDSDTSDDYGPSLPPARGSAAEAAMYLAHEQASAETARVLTNTKAKRDDWMVIPPSSSDQSSRADPTKLKNRKFASGKGSKAPTDKSGTISAIWTETPSEKRQRLEDEVLGRKEAATSNNAQPEKGRRKADKNEEETERRIREYNDKNRNKSLYEEHKGKTQAEKDDDPSLRGFDREKDMAIGGRLGHGEKREMLAKAADFGTRFQKGKYL